MCIIIDTISYCNSSYATKKSGNVSFSASQFIIYCAYYKCIYPFQDISGWMSIISSLQFRNNKTKKIKSTLPFKKGWLITLRAVSMLIDEFFQRDDISFVLTRRLNQDAVEVSSCN